MDPNNPLNRNLPDTDLPQAVIDFACGLAQYPPFAYWPLHLEPLDSRVPLGCLLDVQARVTDYGVELMLLLIRLQHADRCGLVDGEDVAVLEPALRALCDVADVTEAFLSHEVEWRRSWADGEAA